VNRAVSCVSVLLLAAGVATAAVPAEEAPFVRLQTGEGEILIALFPDLAPHHVAAFLHLAASGFYEGTTFHRIVPGFVIQAGDPNSKDKDPRNDGQGAPTLADVLTMPELSVLGEAGKVVEAKGFVWAGGEQPARLAAELSRTAKHLRGTLSMARGRDVNSAGSQFFICVAASPQLDGEYTIFGQVITGMEVADRIAAGATTPSIAQHALDPVPITRVDIVHGAPSLTEAERAAYTQALADVAAGGSTW
jgi:cyclophilin family peptidyl-prolyl cis-trans isomerase